MKFSTGLFLALVVCGIITAAVVWIAGDEVRCQTTECLIGE